MEKLDKLPSANDILADLCSLSALPPSVKISLKNDRLALDAEKTNQKDDQEPAIIHERFAGLEMGHWNAQRNHERILGQDSTPAESQESILRLVEHLIQADGILTESAHRLSQLDAEESELDRELVSLQQQGTAALES